MKEMTPEEMQLAIHALQGENFLLRGYVEGFMRHLPDHVIAKVAESLRHRAKPPAPLRAGFDAAEAAIAQNR